MSETAVHVCENCDRTLPDWEDCRCDPEGLWFCLPCWEALQEPIVPEHGGSN